VKRALLSIMLMILPAGCVGVETEVPAPPVVETAASEPEAQESVTAEASVEFEELVFEGNGNTFLDRIEQAVREAGAPDRHEYVEIQDADGELWQGERLLYPDRRLLFLQAAGSGGSAAVSLTSAADVNADALASALTATAPERVESPAPEIQSVRVRSQGEGVWSFDVTLAYPDTGWDDYTDGWHVESEDGEILGTRILLHPHVGEQPFTRGLSGVAIPAGTAEIFIRSHDLVSGYSQERVAVQLVED